MHNVHKNCRGTVLTRAERLVECEGLGGKLYGSMAKFECGVEQEIFFKKSIHPLYSYHSESGFPC